jgi:hypothetical protein
MTLSNYNRMLHYCHFSHINKIEYGVQQRWHKFSSSGIPVERCLIGLFIYLLYYSILFDLVTVLLLREHATVNVKCDN